SRKGTPMEMLDCPLPSRLSSTAMSVSFVLRWMFATRESFFILATDFTDCFQQVVVLVGCANADAKVITQHRIAAHVTNQDVSLQQLLEHLRGIRGGSHDHEVSFGSDGSKSIDERQL